MAKDNLRKEILEHKFDFGIMKKVPCTQKENEKYAQMLKEGMSLPKDVYAYSYNGEDSTNEFYTIEGSNLTEQEIAELVSYKKLSYLRTIKNCVMFFTVLAVISLILGLISAIPACVALN